MLKFRRRKEGEQGIKARKSQPEKAGVTLTSRELEARARKNIKMIAICGLILIAADLVISLTGSSIEIVQDKGRLYLVRPAAGEDPGNISLNASVKTDKGTYDNDFNIQLDPQEKDNSSSDGEGEGSFGGVNDRVAAEELVRNEFRTIAAGFNEDLSTRRVPLPMTLSSGEAIHWRQIRSTNVLLLSVMIIFLMVFVYRSRFRPLQRQAQAQRESVKLQLPSFINELVLLLNAGLVLSRAFEVTVEQLMMPASLGPGPRASPGMGSRSADPTDPSEDSDYFRQNIRRIYTSVKNTNGVMHEELRAFARESGVTELMRVSGIISDNINKGSELNVKLERESEALWLTRKLQAEERGRLAETKMTLPLSMFLVVVIVITISPAMLQL